MYTAIKLVDLMFLKGHVGRFHVMVFQNNEKEAMLVSQTNPRKPFFVNAFFCSSVFCIDAGHVGENALNHSIFPKSVTQAFSERKLLFKSLIEEKRSMALHVIGWNALPLSYS